MTTRAQNLVPQPLRPSPSSSSPGPGSTTSVLKKTTTLRTYYCVCVLIRVEKLLDQHFFTYQLVCLQCELTPVEALCDMAGASLAEAAANMERGSVPSSMELRGSTGAEEEEEEDEEVLPLRAPRRVFVSVTWVERRVRGQSCTFQMQKNNRIMIFTTSMVDFNFKQHNRLCLTMQMEKLMQTLWQRCTVSECMCAELMMVFVMRW